MSSLKHGTNTLEYEVTNIEKFGFWLYNAGQEFFIDYESYPEFQNAPVKSILNIQKKDPAQFHWPDLDIDIELSALTNPDKYPNQFKRN